MINKELEITIEATVRDAESKHHEYLSVEHILFAILHDERGTEIITNCGGNVEDLKSMLEDFFERNIPKFPEGEDSENYPEPTIAFRRVFQTAIAHVTSAEKTEADAGDLLSAIFLEKDSHAIHFLETSGVTRIDVLNYISHGISKTADGPHGSPETMPCPSSKEQPARKDALKLFTVDLVSKAADGGIDPLVGRENELKRTVPIWKKEITPDGDYWVEEHP